MSVVPSHDLDQRNRAGLDYGTIEHLDWEHTPQCEHSQHGDPLWAHMHGGSAYVLVRIDAHCRGTHYKYFCRPLWDEVVRGVRVVCACGTSRSGYSVYTPAGWVE